MLTLILVIIYLAFISLGLPDSLLGSAWPVMQSDLSVAMSSAGIISMIISGGNNYFKFIKRQNNQSFWYWQGDIC